MPPLRARGPSLTWRVALLAGTAIATLAGVMMLVSYLVVREGLYRDLRRALREDAATVAALYGSGEGSVASTLSGPTGGVVLQVYSASGQLLVASRPEYERAQAAIPPSDVAVASQVPTSWSGPLAGKRIEAALAPFSFGVVAVLADPGYIGASLAHLSRALLLAAVALVAASLVVGYGVAAASLRPLTRLARLAGVLGPDRLEPIGYRGPDDEVGRLTDALNGLVARLGEAMNAQRVFLAETSHELRTPLTSLRGFLDRATRRAGPEVREDLLDAQRVAGTMTRLVEDLLQLSRGQVVREDRPHLVDVERDVLAAVAAEFDGVTLAVRDAALVLGDPVRLRQMMRNLTANAVRAAGRPAGVELALEVVGPSAVLRVHDDGPGIAEDALPRIFEKFFKGVGGGSGLGLAIAKQIAEHHDGDIRVESRPGRTVFEVRLPRVEVEADDEGVA